MSARQRISTVIIAAFMVLSVLPAAANAATIYVNRGVSGATLGMNDVRAARMLGRVQRIYRDSSYDETIWVRCFGRKVGGHYALYLYSNGRHRVTAFIVYASSYRTTKGIHTGSTLASLKRAYGSRLVRKPDSNYALTGSPGKTWFKVTGGVVRRIWIWQ